MANALPLLLLAAGGVVLLSSKKKKKKNSTGTPYASGETYGEPGAETTVPSTKPKGGGSGTSSDKGLKPQVIEQMLFDLGYPPGEIDGAYDAVTVTAITTFQQDWNALMEWIRNRYPQLADKAAYKAIGEDGAWGPATEARAIRAIDMISAGGMVAKIEGENVPVENFRDYVIQTYQSN